MSDIELYSDRELSEMRKLLTEIKKDLPVHLEFQAVQAQLTRAKFNALVVEGFTTEEALELCKQ